MIGVKGIIANLALSCLFLATGLQANELSIGAVPDPNDFRLRLLEAFVERSESYDAVEYLGAIEVSAASALMEQGEVDVVWAATAADLEQQMQAIYVPIYRGTLGFRIAIVERDKADILASIESLEELRELWACQGKTWTDTRILEANGITVAKSLKYANLFRMLEADRCEYFPRGMFEPWSEIDQRPELDLVVDDHILIRYPSPYLFFVRKGNDALATEMTEVFTQMYDDGSFESMFFSNPQVRMALSQSNLGQRKIFEFANPWLTEAVLNIPERYWYRPEIAAANGEDGS